ncbi:complement C1q subcomponent subunit B [Anguilla anguilla]|uniref:C1q domain-containing protein n=1 Tax=Anguilla anguilla TaxID=7936 RepID=A0A0E9WY23_ANGAN|nr:complement C1q subcomponent subunit B [Anguilla anguilla]KAG5844304.1 hypothetical protein ANANG_G00161040 [Anguilla anguilla]
MMSVQATALIGILISFVTSSVADTCSAYRGYPGVPGIPGSHGPNGKDGPKGLKGDDGDHGQLLKGQKGKPGLMGFPGRAGVEGDPGFPGIPGFPGPKGERGISMAVTSSKKSYFSVKKFYKNQLKRDTPIEFEGAVVEGDSLNKGVFRSTIKGYYYFAFHVTGRAVICLNIKKGLETKVGFCDSAERGFLVTSGSLVLKLEVGDEVSLQPTDNISVTSGAGADSIFTGFLLFAVS